MMITKLPLLEDSESIYHLEFALFCLKDAKKLLVDTFAYRVIEFVETWLAEPNSIPDFYSIMENTCIPYSISDGKFIVNHSGMVKIKSTDINTLNVLFGLLLKRPKQCYEYAKSVMFLASEVRNYLDYSIDFDSGIRKYDHMFKLKRSVWIRKWKNPSTELVALSRCKDDIILDYLIDTGLIDCLIPLKNVYYLDLPGFMDNFIGINRDIVIEKIMSSPAKNRVLAAIKRMI